MNVNKFPFLLSSTCFPWLSLRNELFSCSINIRRKFASARCFVDSHGIGPQPVPKYHFSLTNCISNLNYRHLSRYSASTIMRPNSKSFSFNEYDVIGFDLDGTVLRYNLDEMVPLEYELLCRYLVEQKGYSKNLLRLLDKPDDIDFLQKGLFLDTERGNLLKLDYNGCILKANHGTRPLTDLEIVAVYGEERQWSVTTQFINEPLCAWNGPLADKLRSLLDYFDISVSLVFAHAIDEVDAGRKKDNIEEYSNYTVWADVLEGLIHIYTRENFSNGKSGYFEKLKSDPGRFLLKTSPAVIDWLQKLKASKKKLYLLTGSHIDFANFTASYALGENWRDLFDVVICFARKPGFFHASREFYHIEGLRETAPLARDEELQSNKVYSMGNWKRLQKFFAQSIGTEVSKMNSLYVGDNLIQDVYAPQALANMDSVAISEEMFSETLSDRPNSFKDIIASRYWNSYFYEDGVPTIWTHIISKHSRMCVPSLEVAAEKPIDYRFTMSNEVGFYPTPPILK